MIARFAKKYCCLNHLQITKKEIEKEKCRNGILMYVVSASSLKIAIYKPYTHTHTHGKNTDWMIITGMSS